MLTIFIIVLVFLIVVDSVLYENILERFHEPQQFSEKSPLHSFSPQTVSTGTTIVGICCIDGVVLGADTRSTGGHLIVNKDALKIHHISDKIQCCAAGTAALCSALSRLAGMDLRQHNINYESFDRVSNRESLVRVAVSSLRRRFVPGMSVFIVGGVDGTGNHLFQIDGDGITQKIKFNSMGSGSVAALSILENLCANRSFTSEYHVNLTTDEAIPIVRKAVQAGILNDLGSGSHVDLCVIKHESVKKWRELSVSQKEETPLPHSKKRHFFQPDFKKVKDQSIEYLGKKVWSKSKPRFGIKDGKFVEVIDINRDEKIDFQII